MLQLPTDSNGPGQQELGHGRVPSSFCGWKKGDPWVYGALVNNIWSLTSDQPGGSYNNGLIQPFVNYNFPGGFYLTSGPILTVNWKAASGQQWTVPSGGGIGKIFHIGKLPVNTTLQAYYNVVKPDFGHQLAGPRAGAVHVPEVGTFGNAGRMWSVLALGLGARMVKEVMDKAVCGAAAVTGSPVAVNFRSNGYIPSVGRS